MFALSSAAMADQKYWNCTQDTPKYAKKISIEISDEYAHIEWHGKTCDLTLDPSYRPTTYKNYRRFNSDSVACGDIFTSEGGVNRLWLTSLRAAFFEDRPNPRKTVFLDMQPSDGFNFTWKFKCEERDDNE